ncbi:MAG: glycosyltransferase [Opitutus sp.]|nr:glycosyltransferase [Opitutus sp.]
MKIRLFYHSLVSDWNHGNAHFLRGVASELVARRHDVVTYEPRDSWSATNLVAEHGRAPLRKWREVYPRLKSVRYDASKVNYERLVRGTDLVIVHEWNPPELVGALGALRRKHGFVLLYHDTHHRLITETSAMHACDLSAYDGVLAYGEVLRRIYVTERGVRRAWTWHEAADTRVFKPLAGVEPGGDLVWIGNWGDDERSEELREFLIEPVKKLGLKARVYGVRYPEHARAQLAEAGIEYAGWLPNFEVPQVFAQFKVTVHVPRRPYVRALPGIPTIRPFEALACGIPLVCSPWRDTEHLFTPGKDFRIARDGAQMVRQLQALLGDERKRRAQVRHGLKTVRARHTCARRVEELLAIHRQVLAERKAVVVPAARLFRRKPAAAHEATAG